MRGPQLLARVRTPALEAQPLAVQQMRPRMLPADARPPEPLDRLPVQRLRRLWLAQQRSIPRLESEGPRSGSVTCPTRGSTYVRGFSRAMCCSSSGRPSRRHRAPTTASRRSSSATARSSCRRCTTPRSRPKPHGATAAPSRPRQPTRRAGCREDSGERGAQTHRVVGDARSLSRLEMERLADRASVRRAVTRRSARPPCTRRTSRASSRRARRCAARARRARPRRAGGRRPGRSPS
jgi:hypothetical protein